MDPRTLEMANLKYLDIDFDEGQRQLIEEGEGLRWTNLFEHYNSLGFDDLRLFRVRAATLTVLNTEEGNAFLREMEQEPCRRSGS